MLFVKQDARPVICHGKVRSEMDKQRNERERKELNKRLLKSTFIREVKNRKKIKGFAYVIDFICFLLALYLADRIVEILSVNFLLLDIAIYAGLVFAIRFICRIFIKKIWK